MCCIIAKPRHARLPNRVILERIAQQNPDGFGIITPEYTLKTLNAKRFLAALDDIPTSTPCLIHFRKATHGSVSLKNCHPFKHGNVYMMHNGIIPCHPLNDETDSKYFLDNALAPIMDSFGMDSMQFRAALAGAGNSRLAFMDLSKKRMYLFGHWTEVNGIYYSNPLSVPYGSNTRRINFSGCCVNKSAFIGDTKSCLVKKSNSVIAG